MVKEIGGEHGKIPEGSKHSERKYTGDKATIKHTHKMAVEKFESNGKTFLAVGTSGPRNKTQDPPKFNYSVDALGETGETSPASSLGLRSIGLSKEESGPKETKAIHEKKKAGHHHEPKAPPPKKHKP